MSRIQESHVRKQENDEEKALNIWDCGSPLYDAHELVAVSHVVERHFMVLPYLSGSRTSLVRTHEVSCSSEKAARTTSSGGRPSVLGFLSRNVWKRKRKMDEEGKKHKKVKKQKTGVSKIFAWRK